MTFPKGDVNSVSVKEEELPLTPPSEGLAAHFSSPGTVLVSSRVTKMHTHKQNAGGLRANSLQWGRKINNGV